MTNMFPSGRPTASASDSTEDSAPSWLHNPSFDQSASSFDCIHPSEPRPPEHTTSHKHKQPPTKPTQDVYTINATQDKSNLRYDSLYSGHVSSYTRQFPVLGLSSDQAISLDDGRGRRGGRNKRHKEKSNRYFTSPSPAKCEEMLSVCGSEVVSLGEVVSLSPSDGPTHESYSTTDSRTRDYNQALAADPHNVQLWLKFITAQHSLCNGVKEAAMNDRKMAIFERALSSNPKSVELLCGHMRLLATLKEPNFVLKRWKELVFIQPNVPQLWMGYINFCQNDFTNFSSESVGSVYGKCLHTLSMIQEGTLKSHSPLPNSQQWTLHIFQSYCEFLKGSGHTERGVAAYQALLELNLCSPSHLLAAPLETLLTELGHFWRSHSPRLGERHARGWTNQPPQGPQLDINLTSDPPLEDDDVDLVSGVPEKEAWLRLEGHRGAWHFLPWVQEEDPLDRERIVFFESIQSILFRVESKQLKLELVMRFLQYLGALTPTPYTGYVVEPVQLSSSIVSVFSSLLSDGVNIGSSLNPSPLACESIAELVEVLSESLLHNQQPPPTHSLVYATISYLCQQCLTHLSSCEHAGTQLGLVWTANTLKASQGNTALKKLPQKVIKTLLKTQRNNLELWRCCALVEHLLGNDCLAVFHTLLASSLTPRLVATLVEVTMTTADPPQAALNALLCLSEGTYTTGPVTPTRILRANFSPPSNGSPLDVLHSGLCKVYFEYLTAGLSRACATLEELCSCLCAHSDLLLTLRVRQVRLCLQSPRTEPRYLRGVLESGLVVCPGHPWLLANKLLLEEQAFSVGRLHRGDPSYGGGQLFAVLQELRRLERMATLSGSSKGALRRALGLLESSVGRAQPMGLLETAVGRAQPMGLLETAVSRAQPMGLLETAGTQPLLWRVYLIVQALVDPSQLMALFYRAIHACPWSKALYMEGAALLPGNQLKQVLEVMEDKGIRLRTPLEEVQLLLTE